MSDVMTKPRPATVEDGKPKQAGPLSAEELRKIDAYWRACNYLAVGMIYLRENPLLREPLRPEHVKKTASPGQSCECGGALMTPAIAKVGELSVNCGYRTQGSQMIKRITNVIYVTMALSLTPLAGCK